MSVDHFERLFSSFEEDAFRLEALPSYHIEESGEAADFEAYLSGEPTRILTPEDWCDNLRTWTSEGKEVRRLRVIPDYPEPYVNYEIEWGYTQNADCGEQIYLISSSAFSERFGSKPSDFWLFDDAEAISMIYDDDCSYQGSELLSPPPDWCIQVAREADKIGTSLRDYLSWVRNNPAKIDLPE